MNIIMPATGQLIEKFSETLRRTQFLPPPQMVQYQHELLDKLVRHARAHVPFYRESARLDPLFHGGRADPDWDRWQEIPPLTRKDVQESAAALRSEALPPEHGHTWTLSTSGSTGQPVSVIHSHLSGGIGWTSVMLRMLQHNQIDATKRVLVISNFPPDGFPSNGIRRMDHWSPYFESAGLRGERFDLLNTKPVKDLVETTLSVRPPYLWSQPTTLELMCAQDGEGNLTGLGIEAIMVAGEQLLPALREQIARHFGARICEIYSSQECGVIAIACPHCRRFHVQAEVNFVEILDDAGTPARVGQTGSVLVTPLYNYAMPLLRYAHADSARVGQPGRCEIKLPALDAVIGKEFTAFYFPGGVIVRPVVPATAVVKYLGATTFQIAQVADDRCEFRFVPGRLPASVMQFDKMTALLRQIWWSELNVEYRIVDQIPNEVGRSKKKIYVREIPAPARE